MLGSILKDQFRSRKTASAAEFPRHRVLNVGGGSKEIPIPCHFDGWEHQLLDVDSRGKPDIVCDARKLETLKAGQFDAVYCSHNLEHYFQHDGAKVLRGFVHVLKADGFAEIRVPDIQEVLNRVVHLGMDLADVLYQSAAGPISPHDVLYGYGKEIERSGQDFYAHKTGFTLKTLRRALEQAGFSSILATEVPAAFELRAFAFKTAPTVEQLRLLGLAHC